MSITNTIDKKGQENKISILIQSQNKWPQIATIAIIFSFNLIFFVLINIPFNREVFVSFENQLKYFTPTFFIIGWLLGIWFSNIGYLILSLTFWASKSKKGIIQMLEHDEIINEFGIHKKYLDRVFEIDKNFYYQTLDSYYLNTPYSNDVVIELINKFDQKKQPSAIIEYLNSSREIIIFKNTEESLLSSFKFKNKMILRYILEIKQFDKSIASTDDILHDVFKRKYFFYLFIRLQKVYSSFTLSSTHYRKELDNYRQKLVNEFSIKPTTYLFSTIEIIDKKLTDQIEILIKDYENYEITIVVLEKNLKITKGKAYLNIQLISQQKHRIRINDIKLFNSKIPPRDLLFEKFDYEKQIEPKSYIQISVPIKINKEISTEIAIVLEYQIQKDEIKFKEKRENIVFSRIPTFRSVQNPYTLKPVSSAKMFFGREKEIKEIYRDLKAVNYPSIITISGARRIGKTSFLFTLNRIFEEDYTVYYTDVQFLDFKFNSAIGFINELLIKNKLQPVKETKVEEFFVLLSSTRTILLIDEFDVAIKKMGKEESLKFLRCVRDYEIDNKPVFIFSIPNDFIAKLDLEIHNILFSGLPINLTALDKKSTIDLIIKPLQDNIVFTPQSYLHIYRKCGGFPNLLQIYCFSMINFNQEESKSSEINYDIITKYENTSTVNMGEQAIIILKSLSENQRKILWVLKQNENRIRREEIELEILKYFKILEVHDVLNQMNSDNVLDIVNNNYICTSQILIDQINERIL
jgi:hypothetical protein